MAEQRTIENMLGEILRRIERLETNVSQQANILPPMPTTGDLLRDRMGTAPVAPVAANPQIGLRANVRTPEQPPQPQQAAQEPARFAPDIPQTPRPVEPPRQAPRQPLAMEGSHPRVEDRYRPQADNFVEAKQAALDMVRERARQEAEVHRARRDAQWGQQRPLPEPTVPPTPATWTVQGRESPDTPPKEPPPDNRPIGQQSPGAIPPAPGAETYTFERFATATTDAMSAVARTMAALIDRMKFVCRQAEETERQVTMTNYE